MNKKIAYLYLHASSKGSSVQTKIANQVFFMNKHCDLDVFFFYTIHDLADGTGMLNINPVRYDFELNGYFKSTREYSAQIKFVRRWLKNNYQKYDYFILRQPKSCFQSYLMTRNFGDKLVFEVQSKNINEIIANKTENPLRFSVSSILSWFEHYFLPIIKILFFERMIFREVHKIITVTNELKYDVLKYLKGTEKFGKVKHVGNGVFFSDDSNNKVLLNKHFDGKMLNLLLMMGAGADAKWVGKDIIIDKLIEYKGDCHIVLNICGNNINSVPDIKGQYYEINYLGYLQGDNLENIYKDSHLGIGSMAMHRAGLKEGSTLKIREYIKNDLPCVFGHIDSDLDEFINEKILLQVKPNNLCFDSVVNFAYEFYNNYQNNVIKMRRLAIIKLNLEVKIKELMLFICEKR